MGHRSDEERVHERARDKRDADEAALREVVRERFGFSSGPMNIFTCVDGHPIVLTIHGGGVEIATRVVDLEASADKK